MLLRVTQTAAFSDQGLLPAALADATKVAKKNLGVDGRIDLMAGLTLLPACSFRLAIGHTIDISASASVWHH
jgi:hypothetical protein